MAMALSAGRVEFIELLAHRRPDVRARQTVEQTTRHLFALIRGDNTHVPQAIPYIQQHPVRQGKAHLGGRLQERIPQLPRLPLQILLDDGRLSRKQGFPLLVLLLQITADLR